MRFAIAQINPTVGDFRANAAKILSCTKRARDKHCDLVVFSELALFGYPPYDLLERENLVSTQLGELQKIHRQIPAGITVIGGAVTVSKSGKPFHNSAFVMQKGKPIQWAHKQLLPEYDIFDEGRFFEPGSGTAFFKLPKLGRFAVTICEDMWAKNPQVRRSFYQCNPFDEIKKGSVDFIVNISASPFSVRHEKDRTKLATSIARQKRAPFIYVNQVGAQDEVIFDGNSFVADEKGKILVAAASFEEDLLIVDMKRRATEYRPHPQDDVEKIHKALVLGIRDFVTKTGQKKVHLGLSGGIDSALVAALAVDALGPGHVVGVLMPGPFSSKGSIDDAYALTRALKIQTFELPIHEEFQLLSKEFKKILPEADLDRTFENLQARLRGLKLMAISNGLGSMLLSTSNKSEMCVGYSTLYGDMCGGLAPIADLTKAWIYKLARHYNAGGSEIIPESSIQKAPSAELKANQKDTDTLPEYPILDKAVENLVEEKKAARSPTERWVLEALYRSEFKRWQAPPVLRVTDHAFGRGRRFPIAHRAKD